MTDVTKEVIAAIILLLMIVMVTGVLKRRPKTLNPEYFKSKWQVLQKQCANKSTWALAVIDADKLLDEALKKRHYKGKTMGERLVAAQRELTNNDGVWFGHKLRNRLVHETGIKLTKQEVQEALFG